MKIKNIISLGICALSVLAAAAEDAKAGIVLTVTGTPGSSDFTMTASGSFSHSNTEVSGNAGGKFFRVPLTDGIWYTPSSHDWGGTIFSSMPDYVASGTSGALTFEITGDVTSTHTFSDLYRGTEVWVPFDDSNSNDWPDLGATDSVTINASGSINFTASITYDQLNPGTYNFTGGAQDSLQFVVTTAVPEPTSFAMFGTICLAACARRRRS